MARLSKCCLTALMTLTAVGAFAQDAAELADPDDIEATRNATPTLAELEDADLDLVHPYAAVVRSAIVPGWGQARIGQYVQGTVFLAVTGGLVAGWFIKDQQFRDDYDHLYLPAVAEHGVTSAEAKAIYLDVNADYKLSRTFLITGAIVWAYSLIDAYVDANIYNAELRAKRLLEQGSDPRLFQLNIDREPSLSVNVAF
ncbi:MAG: DUF5683 domain-containing protein [Candidatus Poribacteria bacterium]|nr:DUF5683 domain-containing protein [Candidatus Poribacteria bacterium]